MHDKLTAILQAKQFEVAALKQQLIHAPEGELARIDRGESIFLTPKKDVKQALAYAQFIKVIAEIKRRSPAKGALAEIKDPFSLAQQYVAGGAAAISVLTERSSFAGSLDDLQTVSGALTTTQVPVLRKDFLIDPLQIAESLLHGADMILLIVAILGEQLPAMLEKARALKIPALVEVHTKAEINQALAAGAELIGVNNRNLKTFAIDTQCALDLAAYLPSSVLKIAESGIFEVELAQKYHQAGYAAVLVGEALVKSPNPAQWISACGVPL